MTEKKNHIKRNLIVGGIIITVAISVVGFFQTQINSMISSHPKIAEIERVQGLNAYKYDELKKMLQDIDYKIEVLDDKVTKLLIEEYP